LEGKAEVAEEAWTPFEEKMVPSWKGLKLMIGDSSDATCSLGTELIRLYLGDYSDCVVNYRLARVRLYYYGHTTPSLLGAVRIRVT